MPQPTSISVGTKAFYRSASMPDRVFWAKFVRTECEQSSGPQADHIVR
jgi:hypothetical protein